MKQIDSQKISVTKGTEKKLQAEDEELNQQRCADREKERGQGFSKQFK